MFLSCEDSTETKGACVGSKGGYKHCYIKLAEECNEEYTENSTCDEVGYSVECEDNYFVTEKRECATVFSEDENDSATSLKGCKMGLGVCFQYTGNYWENLENIEDTCTENGGTPIEDCKIAALGVCITDPYGEKEVKQYQIVQENLSLFEGACEKAYGIWYDL